MDDASRIGGNENVGGIRPEKPRDRGRTQIGKMRERRITPKEKAIEKAQKIKFYNSHVPKDVKLSDSATEKVVERAFNDLSQEIKEKFEEFKDKSKTPSMARNVADLAKNIVGIKQKKPLEEARKKAEEIGNILLKSKIEEESSAKSKFSNRSEGGIELEGGRCLIPNINLDRNSRIYEGVVVDKNNKLHFVIDPSRVRTENLKGENISGFRFEYEDRLTGEHTVSFKSLRMLVKEVAAELIDLGIAPRGFVTVFDESNPIQITCSQILKSYLADSLENKRIKGKM